MMSGESDLSIREVRNSTVGSFPQCSVFHTASWAEVLLRTYGFRTTYATVERPGLAAALPITVVPHGLLCRKAVSVPFADSCAPLVSQPELLEPLMSVVGARARRSRWSSLEIRGGDPPSSEWVCAACYVEHIICLARDTRTLWSRLRPSTQRSIRKAQRAGVRVSISRSRDAMAIYYRLHCSTRRRHGSPPQSRRFFDCLHESVVARGNGLVALAWTGATPVAGAVFLHAGRQAIYKYGASRKEFQELRANNLVMWVGMKWCAEHGCESLSLGRTDSDDFGLLQFKDGWGGERRALRYWRLAIRQPESIGSVGYIGAFQLLARQFLRILPIPLLRFVGAAAYRYLA